MTHQDEHADGPDPEVLKGALMYEHLVTVSGAVFPKYAGIQRSFDGRDFCLRITWVLKSDPTRPHRTSRPVQIRFLRDTLDEYTKLDETQRLLADDRLMQSLRELVEGFDGEHETPAPGLPDPVRVVVMPEMVIPRAAKEERK